MAKIMKHFLNIGACIILLAGLGCPDASGGDSTLWAKPVKVEGVPGLFRVTPDLYRSGQPTLEGLRNLKAMGIKTVINTRDFHSDRDEVLAAGLQYERIHMKAWLPLEKDAVRFLKIVTDPKRTPVLVHCWLSSDRSGTLIAIYRIAVQGWSREDAIQEMTEGDFGFHRILIDLPIWINIGKHRTHQKEGWHQIHQPRDEPGSAEEMMRRGQAVRSALLPLFLLLLVLLLSGCATLPLAIPAPVSTALSLPEATAWGKKSRPGLSDTTGNQDFTSWLSGDDAFMARLLAVDLAEKTIDLQYYVFQADFTGKLMLDRLVAAAERGVRVRLLLDDWKATAKMDRWPGHDEVYPNIQVRVFNPFGGLRSNPLSRPLQAIFGPKRLKGGCTTRRSSSTTAWPSWVAQYRR